MTKTCSEESAESESESAELKSIQLIGEAIREVLSKWTYYVGRRNTLKILLKKMQYS